MRAKDLFKLVKDVKKKYPRIKKIQMGSWLNEYKPFRSLFPKTWKPTKKERKKRIASHGGVNLLDPMEILMKIFIRNLKKN